MINDWKDRYHELILENALEAQDEARELKKNNLPKKLYRYRSFTKKNGIQRLYEIENGKLYLSRPEDFNDLFDVSSQLRHDSFSEYHRKDTFEETFRNKISQEDYEMIFQSEDWYDRLMEYGANIEAPEGMKDQWKASINGAIRKEFELLNEDINKMVRKSIRCACFTTKPDNGSMWANYADDHHGICLEYDTSKIENIYQINRLFPVYYVDKLPDMVYDMMKNRYPTFMFFEYLAIHKTKEWAYEDEWRLVYDASSFYWSKNDIPEEYWKTGKLINFICPSKIFLGARIDYPSEKVIRIAAEQKDIPVVKAKKTSYGLRFE